MRKRHRDRKIFAPALSISAPKYAESYLKSTAAHMAQSASRSIIKEKSLSIKFWALPEPL